MKKTYIVVLKNNYLLFFAKKPKKQGHYLKDVRLFETDIQTSSQEICDWVQEKYESAVIQEVENWE